MDKFGRTMLKVDYVLPDGITLRSVSGWEKGNTAYQADLERQFEHVWAQWLNSPSFPVPGAGKEALVGQSPPTGKRPAVASRWGQGGASVHLSLPTFVHPRLGAYFFAPGIDALVR